MATSRPPARSRRTVEFRDPRAEPGSVGVHEEVVGVPRRDRQRSSVVPPAPEPAPRSTSGRSVTGTRPAGETRPSDRPPGSVAADEGDLRRRVLQLHTELAHATESLARSQSERAEEAMRQQAMRQQLEEALARSEQAAARIAVLDQQLAEAATRARQQVAEAQALADQRAAEALERAELAADRAAIAEQRAAQAEQEATHLADLRAVASDQRLMVANQRAAQAEQRAAIAEQRAEQAEQGLAAATARLEALTAQLADRDTRLASLEQSLALETQQRRALDAEIDRQHMAQAATHERQRLEQSAERDRQKLEQAAQLLEAQAQVRLEFTNLETSMGQQLETLLGEREALQGKVKDLQTALLVEREARVQARQAYESALARARGRDGTSERPAKG